ncbi:MAG: aminotransferase class I/II-fold pyridoxal phosphate-dependent enzyme, partial [Phycisphaeraceae bacterium]|nr:aminotransferase class I/II-fold pyridoxal phosphate-dependent enzyme [Phycisphaeraceae bacterium]
ERDRMTTELTRRGFHVFPSATNFLLVVPPATGPDAATLHERLKAANVFVRYFDAPRLKDKLRITIGTAQQNDALLSALDELAPA